MLTNRGKYCHIHLMGLAGKFTKGDTHKVLNPQNRVNDEPYLILL